mgnify:CR=1 FL=1
MKKVAIVGLGWLGMPLAMSLATKGWQVTGSKTTADGVEAARMCGIDGIELRLEPELVCDADDLDALMNVDALVITLPARRTGARTLLNNGHLWVREFALGQWERSRVIGLSGVVLSRRPALDDSPD